PRNREFQVDCIKESITLQPNNSCYPVKTSYELSEECTISVNTYCSTANYEPINIKIKLVGWSEDCIYLQIIDTNLDSSDISDDYDQLASIEITVCVLYSNYENLEIDNKKVENSLDLIGCILTENTKVVPFPKFFPLISEISYSCNETIGLLKQRVDAVDFAVRDKDNQGFFNHKNYDYLQNLGKVTARIKNFMAEIPLKNLLKYIQVKNIEKTFKDLRKEFDNSINSLAFTKNSDELDQLKAVQEDLTQYPENMDINMEKSNDDVTEVEAIMKLKNENNNNSYIHQLEFIYYEETNEEPRKNGRVTKWVSVKNKSEEFAFKIISEEEKSMIQNQITILKELHDWQNIIKTYGLTCDGNKWYLVSEWAKYGNLREYYTSYKDRFNPILKLRMSLDIARGLNFLRTVEIVHHDIRAENILITLHETAKLANFKLSRYITAKSLEQSQNLERVRYCAPELLERAPNF
ncbi:kinase-like protein, partial [Rhizophagus irregularis]